MFLGPRFAISLHSACTTSARILVAHSALPGQFVSRELARSACIHRERTVAVVAAPPAREGLAVVAAVALVIALETARARSTALLTHWPVFVVALDIPADAAVGRVAELGCCRQKLVNVQVRTLLAKVRVCKRRIPWTLLRTRTASGHMILAGTINMQTHRGCNYHPEGRGWCFLLRLMKRKHTRGLNCGADAAEEDQQDLLDVDRKHLDSLPACHSGCLAMSLLPSTCL